MLLDNRPRKKKRITAVPPRALKRKSGGNVQAQHKTRAAGVGIWHNESRLRKYRKKRDKRNAIASASKKRNRA